MPTLDEILNHYERQAAAARALLARLDLEHSDRDEEYDEEGGTYKAPAHFQERLQELLNSFCKPKETTND